MSVWLKALSLIIENKDVDHITKNNILKHSNAISYIEDCLLK
jgi:hypothetical protein